MAITRLQACALVLLSIAPCARAQLPAAWEADHAAALVRAEREGRCALVWFTGSDWCKSAGRLEKTVLADPTLLTWARGRCTLVVVDFPRHVRLAPAVRNARKALARRLGVRALPALRIVDPGGRSHGELRLSAVATVNGLRGELVRAARALQRARPAASQRVLRARTRITGDVGIWWRTVPPHATGDLHLDRGWMLGREAGLRGSGRLEVWRGSGSVTRLQPVEDASSLRRVVTRWIETKAPQVASDRKPPR